MPSLLKPWTEQKPNQRGWFWYRPNKHTRDNYASRTPPFIARKKEPSIVEVLPKPSGQWIVRCAGVDVPVDQLAGEWSGPILIPCDVG